MIRKWELDFLEGVKQRHDVQLEPLPPFLIFEVVDLGLRLMACSCEGVQSLEAFALLVVHECLVALPADVVKNIREVHDWDHLTGLESLHLQWHSYFLLRGLL